MSLIAIGTPCSGDLYFPFAISFSAVAADLRASSFKTVTYERSIGSIVAIRSSIIPVSATGESDLSEIRRAAPAMSSFQAVNRSPIAPTSPTRIEIERKRRILFERRRLAIHALPYFGEHGR